MTPPIVSTDGWRPMPPPQGWREAFKDRISAPALQENAGFPSSDSSGYSQESVGHPVLNLLQQHLEAAEKKRPQVPSSELFPPSPPSQRGASLRSQALHKSEVYAPAPPSILGSFSVFGHATLKARDKAKKKKPISDPYFQSSETRSVYQNQPGNSFGSSLNLRPTSVHFPRLRYNSGGGGDLRAEQQQHHTRFFLSPISSGADHTPFGTDTLLVPPQAAEAHGAYFSQGAHHPGHGITSYQVQKFGDYDPSFLSQPFSANAHFAEPQGFNSGNLEDTGPAQFQQQQQQPYPPTNIEFLPEAPVAYPPPRQQQPSAYQPSHLQDDQLTRTPLRSKPQVVTAAPDYAPQEVHVTPQRPFPGRPTEDSRVLTPTPLPDDIAQRHPTGSVFSEYNRFPATPEPLAADERSPPAQLQPLTTHSHPNGASSVVAFSLGDRPPGAFLDAGAPLLGAPHGERGRITRPYFHEPSRAQPEFTMTPEPDTSSDANDEEEESEGEREREPPARRPTPPTATREPFLPTLQPALRQPPFHPHHDAPATLDATHLPPPASNEVGGVPYAPFPRDQDEQQAAHEEETTPAPTADAASAPEDPSSPTALPETSTRLQKPRLRRPGGYRQRYPSAATAPAATEPEPSESPAEEEGSRPPQRYRRPGSARRPQPYYRRRPTSPASDDGNEVQDVRPQRRPSTQRYRQRPNYYADDAQRDNQDYHTSTQYGDTQATRPYRRRRPSTAPPSQHLDDPDHEMDADATLPPYGEHQSVNYEEQATGTAAPLTTTPRSRRLPNYAGGRNRGKDKYARLPSAVRPSAAAATEAPDMMESASEQVEAVISHHNEVVEESAPQPVNHHDEYEVEEEFTTPLPTTSTTPSTTSTTTTTEPPTTASTTTPTTSSTTTTTTPPPLTTTSTTTTPTPEDEVPHATEEASVTVTTLSRLRPRLRYNSTRPRFSVRDYRERLNRTPAPTSTSTTTTTEDPFEALRGTYESTRMRLDTSSVAPPSGPAVSVAPQRVRYPSRHRGTYQYKRPEEETSNHKEDAQPLTTTEAPARGRFTPSKEKTPGRYGGSRYRSSTTTATPTTTPAEVTTDKSKASTSRYRPGTGKYYSRYRSTSEQPSQSGTAPSAEGPPAATAPAASATPKPFVRPKGVFSAVRRPYPLRPPRPGGTRAQPPTAAAPQDNRLDESHVDIDDAASHTAHAVVTPPPSASAASGTGARPPLVLAPKPEENVIEASTLLKKVDEPEHDTESSPSASIEVAPSRHRSSTSTAAPSSAQSGDAPPSKDDDEDTRSTSQRIADLTSAAAFSGGFFKTPASAGFEARRITMATEDPILPIEAFFPIWNNNKEDKSR